MSSLIRSEKYPKFRRDETTFTYGHGYNISDPYQWLENPDAEETVEFVQKQNEITEPLLGSWKLKDQAEKRLTEIYDFEKYSSPSISGGRFYYSHNSGLQNQAVYYVTDSLAEGAKSSVFLDPNTFSEDGTSSCTGLYFSNDGSLCAYGVSDAGSDWFTAYIMDVKSGKLLDDKLERCKFSGLSFTHDNQGLFYNKYPVDGSVASGVSVDAHKFHTLYYHKIGQSQSEDVIAADFPENPAYMSLARVSNDGRYVLLFISETCDSKCLLWFCDLESLNYKIQGRLPWVKAVNKLEAEYHYLHNKGSQFMFMTNKE